VPPGKLKSALNGTRFESVGAVETKSTEVLNGMAPMENTDGAMKRERGEYYYYYEKC